MNTSATWRWPGRVAASLALLASLETGCTSLTSTQEHGLSELNAAAQRVTSHYKVPAMTLRAGWPVNDPWDRGFINTLVLTPEVLSDQTKADFAFAIALGEFVNAYAPCRGSQGRPCDPLKEPLPQRMVNVLMVGRGLSEREAFLVVQDGLRTHPKGPQCVVLNYLIILHPRYQDVARPC